MKKFIVLLTTSVLIFSACAGNGTTNPQINTQSTEENNTMESTTNYTMEQLAQHADKESCWLLIHGKIYDVTEFVQNHPGGESILEGCGKDATTLFETRPMGSGTPHSDKARENMENYYIGDLNP